MLEKKGPVFIIGFIFLVVISFLVIKPYFSAILTGILLSYLLFPAYTRLQHRIHKKSLAAVLLIVIVCLLVVLPSFFLVERLARESIVFYTYTKQVLAEGIPCIDGFGCSIIRSINALLNEPLVARFMDVLVQQASSAVITSMSSVAVQSLSFLFDALIVLFVVYYGFVEGPAWVYALHNIFPFTDYMKQQLSTQLRRISSVIFIGFFFVAFLEGILGYIAFVLVGSSAPLFWGLIIAFTALIPFVSAAMIMIPPILYYIIVGDILAAAVFIFFTFLLFYTDIFLSSLLVGNSTHIHPLVVFIGILGGVQLLGPVGIVLGPFILSFSILLLKLSLR